MSPSVFAYCNQSKTGGGNNLGMRLLPLFTLPSTTHTSPHSHTPSTTHTSHHSHTQVKVDVHSNQSQSTKNTKSLSGGERSYTTVCFIMSLWEAMEAPFRCLDEFDVFMVGQP